MRVGAIDCGTNSIRLLIADADPDAGSDAPGSAPRLRDVVREMRIVRLGAGVDATGWLSEEALRRTFEAAGAYAEQLRRHEVDRVRMVATSATRDAGNRQAFAAGIRERLGIEPEVISGDEEARLSFAGAAAAVPQAAEGRSLVVDIGGGSTEFVLGEADGVIAARSHDIGSVRLTERYLSSNPPTEAQLRRLVEDVDAAVEATLETVPLDTATRLIGVAGSVTTVTARALGLERYDSQAVHGAELGIEEITAAAGELTRMTREQRSDLEYMPAGREDVIGAGAQIWARIAQRIGELTEGRIRTAVTSEQDILDGIALSLLS